MAYRPSQPVPSLAPIPRVPASTVDEINKLMNQYTTLTTDQGDPLPGVVFSAVDRLGNTLVSAGCGPRDISVPDVGVDDQTILFMGTMTKIVTTVACLILVERGVIGLDDCEALYNAVPELATKKILKGFNEDEEPILEDIPASAPKLTLRLLLSDLSGFGTSLSSDDLWEFFDKDISQDDLWGGWEAMLKMPLIEVPGKKWNSSVGFEFVGKAIERLTGMVLGDFCRENIFKPLGLKDTSFEPDPSTYYRIISLHHRMENGTVIVSPINNFGRIYPARNGYHSAWWGLFSTAADWGVFMSTMMNQGLCFQTGKRIIKPETLEHLFTPQLSPEYLPMPLGKSARPEFIRNTPVSSPFGQNRNHGLGLFLVGDKEGVKLSDGTISLSYGTAGWTAASGVVSWIDRSIGISVVIASTILPFEDPVFSELTLKLREIIYSALRRQTKHIGS